MLPPAFSTVHPYGSFVNVFMISSVCMYITIILFRENGRLVTGNDTLWTSNSVMFDGRSSNEFMHVVIISF